MSVPGTINYLSNPVPIGNSFRGVKYIKLKFHLSVLPRLSNKWSCNSTSLCAFMATYLIKQSNVFASSLLPLGTVRDIYIYIRIYIWKLEVLEKGTKIAFTEEDKSFFRRVLWKGCVGWGGGGDLKSLL
jgi:hypothetical protein